GPSSSSASSAPSVPSSSRPSQPTASPAPPGMTESEVGRMAVSIEKEMFNLCMNTDSKYKNKYRSLMFNLKDPKNKGLFYRVVWGDVSPFRLVRLSAEELLSREISEWRKSDSEVRVFVGTQKKMRTTSSTSTAKYAQVNDRNVFNSTGSYPSCPCYLCCARRSSGCQPDDLQRRSLFGSLMTVSAT
uniref:TFIIS central domain-containing protein n=1 Tax=Gadus morhua TaxID=8049 RepID=A0A8C5D271_GADMO